MQRDPRWIKVLTEANRSRNIFEAKLGEAITSYRQRYPDFDEAYISSIGQYGKDSVRVYDLFPIDDVLDPLVIIIGGNATIAYHSEAKTVTGDLGTCNLRTDGIYVIGRREPQDSKLMIWGPQEEVEISNYNPLFSVIPSRIHAAFLLTDNRQGFFTDLGSSSKSIVVGENKTGSFLLVYGQPKLELIEISIRPKYSK